MANQPGFWHGFMTESNAESKIDESPPPPPPPPVDHFAQFDAQFADFGAPVVGPADDFYDQYNQPLAWHPPAAGP